MSESPGAISTLRVLAWRHRFVLTLGVVLAGVAALKLFGLGTAPPGLYNDEASVGYNAWTLAHHGVDEHGASHPLFFEAFGEYKNPVYIYALAPLTWVLPLTPAVERLPAALFGLATVVLVGLLAWELTRQRWVAVVALVMAAVTPWLAVESRVGFEQVTMVMTLTAAIYCYARATRDGAAAGWWWATGAALAVTVYAYSTGRLLVALLVTAMLLVDRRWRRPQILRVLLPVGAAYVVLLLWAHAHPGALTERLNLVGINVDGAGLPVLAGRFLRNYITYFNFQFLFTNGDAYLRHSTGYGGMLLVTTLPLVLLGLVTCVRRWREPVPRLLLVLLILGPVPAALTYENTPHALRSSGMLPALLGLMVYGIAQLLPLLTARRLVAAAVVVAVAIDAGGFMFDLFVRWPGRSLAWFDTGELAAVQDAHDLAGGHTVWLSTNLDVPYIQALFAFRPPPVALPYPDNIGPALAQIGMAELPDVNGRQPQPGDVIVMTPDEQPPTGSTLLKTETVTVAPAAGTPDALLPPPVELVRIWRR
ncbi:MAG TPA: phospholipid carrier-dependent glycosyltransferase [Candidatus Dormibacteraeota bacterium]